MARKKSKPTNVIENATIIEESSSDYLKRISREYGLYILSNRAIPTMTDGLKSSQRIALWLLRRNAGKIKTSALGGEMLASELYNHGDASANDAISYLAAPFNNNVPLISGKGSFGTRIQPIDGIGAPRYTYVKKTKTTEDLVYPDIDIAPMVGNYDDSKFMPSTFLPLVPLVLLNGVVGVGLGYSTKIFPRKLDALVKATKQALNGDDITADLTPSYVKYDSEITQEGGSNRYIMWGKVERVNTTTVTISEMPPGMKIETLREHLIDLVEKNKITDFKDRSKDKINIEVKMKRAELSKMTDIGLLLLFKLRRQDTENLVMLNVDQSGVVQYDNPQQVVKDFTAWRLDWYKKRYEYKLKLEEERIIFYLSVIACLDGTDDIPSIPEILKTTDGKSQLKEKIRLCIENMEIPVIEENVEKIASFPSYRWTSEGRDDLEKRVCDCSDLMDEYNDIIESRDRQIAIFDSELDALLDKYA